MEGLHVHVFLSVCVAGMRQRSPTGKVLFHLSELLTCLLGHLPEMITSLSHASVAQLHQVIWLECMRLCQSWPIAPSKIALSGVCWNACVCVSFGPLRQVRLLDLVSVGMHASVSVLAYCTE